MNKYFVSSGVISLFLSVAHTWWGLINVIPEISSLNPTAMAGLEVAWYQVGATLFAGGIALLVHGMTRQASKAIPALVLAVYFAHFSVFLALVILKYQFVMVQTMTQLVLFSIMLVLLALGFWIPTGSARDHFTSRNINYVSVLNFKQKG